LLDPNEAQYGFLWMGLNPRGYAWRSSTRKNKPKIIFYYLGHHLVPWMIPRSSKARQGRAIC
jgi:hypothetical protein